MKRNKIAILPAVNNCGGDLNKKWFVYFSYRNPSDDGMRRFKVYKGLHKIKDFDKRTAAAENLCKEIRSKLNNGWNPFLDDENAIYEDQLQYNNVARIYGKKRASNKTARFYSSQFLNQYIEAGSVEDGTISTYKSKLRTFTLWLDSRNIGMNDITTIDNQVILDFFDYIINDRKLSGNSVGKYKQILSSLFDYIIYEGTIKTNPVYNIPKCKRINDKAPRPVAEFDIQPFKEKIQAEDPQLWLAICFEYYCFLRPGKELRYLKIGDIDFTRGIIDVDRIRSKTNLERFPTVPLIFLRELRDTYQLQKFPKNYYVFSKDRKPGPLSIGKNNLRTRFRNIRIKLNMPEEYKFYSWKHTGNGRASDAGISSNALQDQNGHTSIKTTEIYLRHKIGKVSQEIRDNFPEI